MAALICSPTLPPLTSQVTIYGWSTSLPPIGYRAFNENGGIGAAAWAPPSIRLQEWPPRRLDFSRYWGDIGRFLADSETEPTVVQSMFLRDASGGDWVVLESFVKQVDPLADKGWRGLQEHSAIDTLLISAGSAEGFLAALLNESHREIRDLIDLHGHVDCCYVGEVGRVGPPCPHRHDEPRPVTMGNNSFLVVPTIEQYTWEGSILDCSIGQSATTVLPSTFIQRAAGLTFDMSGPSWLDSAGAPVFTYYEEPGNDSRALLVRASFLRELLIEQKLEVIVLHWFERMQLGDDYDSKHPYVESRINARLASDLALFEGQLRRTERDLKND